MTYTVSSGTLNPTQLNLCNSTVWKNEIILVSLTAVITEYTLHVTDMMMITGSA